VLTLVLVNAYSTRLASGASMPLQKDIGVIRFRSNQRYPGCYDKMAIGISDTRAKIEEDVLSYRSRMVRGPAGPIGRVAV